MTLSRDKQNCNIREQQRLVELLSSRIDGREDSKARYFERAYSFASYPSTRDEDREECSGIGRLSRIFKKFDPLNNTESHPPLSERHLREATERDFYHLDRFLLDKNFIAERVLRSRSDDNLSAAVYSFALKWTKRSLECYASRNSYRRKMPPPSRRNSSTDRMLPVDSAEAALRRRRFVDAILYDRSSGESCFLHRDGFAYSRSTFRSLARALNSEDSSGPVSEPRRRGFRLTDHLRHDFRDELERLHRALINEESWLLHWRPDRIEPIPYELQRRIGRYDKLKRDARVKFVTGQACCGKTSLLNTLRSRGWKVFSRGDLGSFAGKASDPLSVFGLHAAIDWTLRRDNVLGVSINATWFGLACTDICLFNRRTVAASTTLCGVLLCQCASQPQLQIL